jgi:sterol desaturase/sphingolipid hydroxylase (fatty acid hydroxylase superfamily)
MERAMSELIYWAVPAFLVLLALEALLLTRYPPGDTPVRGYELRDTATSLSLGVGNVLIAGAVKAAVFLFYLGLYELRLFDWKPGLVHWVAIVIAEDACYYWFHRAHHEIRFLWAAHENHHSSRFYNLSTALRQSWTTPLTGILFWAPLPLLGFHPTAILVAQSISLIYQFWIHTELLGPMHLFGRIFNTPSHHRVHHGRNIRYLDRNHGGILIVWDRLFGTFEPEREPVDYGLTKNNTSFNPFRVAFHAWADLFRDMRNAGDWREAAAYFLRPPGWSPDGSSQTSAELRRALALPGGAGVPIAR